MIPGTAGEQVAGGAPKASDRASQWARHIDDCLVRLDGDERLAGLHTIADPHVPLRDLSLVQAFAEIR